MKFDIDDELMGMYKVFYIHDIWRRRYKTVQILNSHFKNQEETTLTNQCNELKKYACDIDQDLWVDLGAMSSKERSDCLHEHKYLDWFIGMQEAYPKAFSEWRLALLAETNDLNKKE